MNREELKRYLEADRQRSEVSSRARLIRGIVCHEPYFLFWSYIRAMRMEGYHSSNSGLVHKLLHYYWRRRRNRLGEKTGISIEPGVIEEGLLIWHPNVVVNTKAKIGKGCTFHGQNCVGNSGHGDEAPVIGDNVSFGVGSSVIGNVRIADGIQIGAGAVVVTSFLEPGISVGGVPAVPLKLRNRGEQHETT